MDAAERMEFPHNMDEVQTQTLSDEAFERVYTQYGKRVYGYFWCKTGNAHTAEDLTADLFLKVIREYGRFDAAKAPFEVWLFRLARNLAVDHHRVQGRKTARTVELDEARDVAAGGTPELRVIQNERDAAVRAAILQLPEKQRHIVSLKYAAGMKNAEIAAIAGLTESNAGVVLHRALEKLRKTMIKQGVDFHE